MFKIAICDDECQFRKIIRELLTDYMNKNGVLYEIDEFSSGRELADLGIEINKYKIVFLDINMDAIIRKMNCVVKKKTFNFNEVTKNVPLERLLYIESRLHKLEVNKIAARWPAKAVAQFSTFSKKGSDRIVPR